jgi:hypothetical protein
LDVGITGWQDHQMVQQEETAGEEIPGKLGQRDIVPRLTHVTIAGEMF